MIQKVARMLALAGAFLVPLVPLIVTDSMFFPYITGKAFFFRTVVEVMLASWFVLALFDSRYRPKRSWIFVAMAVFTVVIALADIFGINPTRSFWSNYERMEGLITILHLIAYLFVAGSVLQSEKRWHVFWNVSIIVSVIVCLKAFAQLTTIAEGAAIRLDATLGNATYLAVYLLFHIFVTLWLLYQHRNEKMWAVGYVLILAIQLPVLYYTGTRGTILGLIGGLTLGALLIALFGRAHPRIRRISAIGLGILVLLVGSFFALRNAEFVQQSSTLSRFANASFTEATVQSRFVLWTDIAFEAFKERPVLGWGQDNFIVAFGTYYDPIMYKQEPWFDRAHNVFVDWLVAGGILGFLSYLFLFGTGLWLLWRGDWSLVEKALLTGLFAGYTIHNIFVFDNLVSYVFFMSLLAMIHARKVYGRDGVVVIKGEHPVPYAIPISAGALLLVLWVIWCGTIVEMSRSRAVIDGLRSEYNTRDYAAALERFEYALEGGPLGRYEMREQLVQVASRAYAAAPEATTTVAIVDRAREETKKSIEEDPRNTRPLSFMGFLTSRTRSYDEAIEYLTRALEINPTRQIFLYDLAEVYGANGDIASAIATYKAAYDVEPENTQALAYYAGMLMLSGRKAEGEATLLEHLGTTSVDNELVIGAYLRDKDYKKLIEIYKFRINVGDDDPQTYVSLALAYLELGMRDEAIATLERSTERYTGQFAVQANQMIEAIRQGKNIIIR